jgi:hypothetical protein
MLPCQEEEVDVWQTLIYRRKSLQLSREFRQYLTTRHGPSWCPRIASLRSIEKAAGPPLRGGDKNKRGEGGRGGTKQPRTQVTNPPTRPATQSKIATMTAQDRDLLLDFQVGSDAVRKQYGSTWWSWDVGFTLNFWRWPEGEQRTAARDGMPAYISGTLPQYFRGAKKPNPESYDLLVKKLRKMFGRGYVIPLLHGEFVESLVDYFFVPKANDIRPVYNGMSLGLNAAVWAPNFWLPTAQSETDVSNYGYSSVDLDLGEMFHNFPLPHVFRPYSGLDLTPFRDDLELEPRSGPYFRAR